jgi:hypothetical protein
MKRVFLVDDSTRVILPESLWAEQVLTAFRAQGRKVELTNQDPDLCERGEEEMLRMHALLESTGI